MTNATRLITQFRAGHDDRVGEINVTHISFDAISRIVKPTLGDPLLHDCYRLSSSQLEAFQTFVQEALERTGIDYFMEAEGALPDQTSR